MAAQLEIINPGLQGHHRERSLRGIPQHLPAAIGLLAMFRIAAEHPGLQQQGLHSCRATRLRSGRRRQRMGAELALGLITLA